MLLVNAKASPSDIHGLGLFAQQFIPKGTAIWQFQSGFDLLIPRHALEDLAPPARQAVLYYAFFHPVWRSYVLSSDDDRFTNHSDTPNTRLVHDRTVALRDIHPHEEITIDYDLMEHPGANQGDEVSIGLSDLGLGIFANRDFQSGDALFRFTGSLITFHESNMNERRECNPVQIGPQVYIDVEPPGVFINHSCDPNAGVRNDIMVCAIRPILCGEEIRMDYSTITSEQRWTMQCACGSPRCRKLIGDFHDIPPSLQRRYLEMGIVQSFIVQEVALRTAD